MEGLPAERVKQIQRVRGQGKINSIYHTSESPLFSQRSVLLNWRKSQLMGLTSASLYEKRLLGEAPCPPGISCPTSVVLTSSSPWPPSRQGSLAPSFSFMGPCLWQALRGYSLLYSSLKFYLVSKAQGLRTGALAHELGLSSNADHVALRSLLNLSGPRFLHL